jgi:hypothetical protein
VPIAIVIALATPALVRASTVAVERGPLLQDVAATGETNHLTLAYNADGSSVTVTDPGATIAVQGCVAIDRTPRAGTSSASGSLPIHRWTIEL